MRSENFVAEEFCNKRFEFQRAGEEKRNKSDSFVKHFTFFLGAGEGGTQDFLASLTLVSDEFLELAAAGEM